MQSIILSLVIALHCVASAPTNHIQPTISKEKINITRQKKGPNYPYEIHQILVPNLHVIPIHGNWNDAHNVTQHNFLIPIHSLVPVHELVPVNRLSVIPLQKNHQVMYHIHDDDPYRNPLGGYGVGWRFGGHGAGHGFHYSYG